MNNFNFSRRIACAAASCALSLLSACGGGSSDASASSDPVDKYLGTYALVCRKAAGVTVQATAASVYEQVTYAYVTKTTAAKATGTATYKYYTTTDCSGTPVYTQTISGTDNYFAIDGASTVDGKSVDKVTLGVGAKYPGFTVGATLSINGMTFTKGMGDVNLLSAYVEKSIFFLDAKNNLFTGDVSQTAKFDAQGYPTALMTTSVAVKQ